MAAVKDRYFSIAQVDMFDVMSTNIVLKVIVLSEDMNEEEVV